ncbi:hypothetical protein HRbin05_00124 [archaeon HR05]|nr:hypothetical protein HRbin05_00124 [archaeon HR05]
MSMDSLNVGILVVNKIDTIMLIYLQWFIA